MSQGDQPDTPGNISPRSTLPKSVQQTRPQSIAAPLNLASGSNSGTVASRVAALNARTQHAQGSGPSISRRASRTTQTPLASAETAPAEKPDASRSISSSSTTGPAEARGPSVRSVKEAAEPIEQLTRRRTSKVPLTTKQSYLSVPVAYIPAGSKHADSKATPDPWAWLPQGNEPLKVHTHSSKELEAVPDAEKPHPLAINPLLNQTTADPPRSPDGEIADKPRSSEEAQASSEALVKQTQPLAIYHPPERSLMTLSQTSSNNIPSMLTSERKSDCEASAAYTQGDYQAAQDLHSHFKRDVHDPVEQQMKSLIDLLDDAIANKSAKLTAAKYKLSQEVGRLEASDMHDSYQDEDTAIAASKGGSNHEGSLAVAGQGKLSRNESMSVSSRANSFHSASRNNVKALTTSGPSQSVDGETAMTQHRSRDLLPQEGTHLQSSDGASPDMSTDHVERPSTLLQTRKTQSPRTDKVPPGMYPPSEAHAKWFDLTGYFNRRDKRGDYSA